jgi:hypothetical protein
MITEWQLWMHPYPTMLKTKRRINPSLVRIGRVYQNGAEFIRLTDLIEAMLEAKKGRNPSQLKRCVLAVAKKDGGEPTRDDVSRAFAICTKQLQKSGYLKKGTQKATKKGKKRSRSKSAEAGHGGKVADYEKMLAGVRKE